MGRRDLNHFGGEEVGIFALSAGLGGYFQFFLLLGSLKLIILMPRTTRP